MEPDVGLHGPVCPSTVFQRQCLYIFDFTMLTITCRRPSGYSSQITVLLAETDAETETEVKLGWG